MKYSIYEDVLNLIKGFINRRKLYCYYMIFFVCVGMLGMFVMVGRQFNFAYFFSSFILIGVFLFTFYKTELPFVTTINNTAILVEICDDEIIIITSSYKYFFYMKESQTHRFKMKTFRLRDSYYPIKEIFDLEKGTLKLFNNQQEIYIVVDFFDKNLKKQLELFYR